MGKPAKPFSVLKTEGKSHMTKAQLKQRQQAEESLLTGSKLKERPEVKNNPIAHKEFNRLNKLLLQIGKNDAIYEPVINRYCQILAECVELENARDLILKNLKELENSKADFDSVQYFKLNNDLQKSLLNLDKQIQTKRRMLLDIEKENIMTVAAALRSVPKREEKKQNKLLEALSDD